MNPHLAAETLDNGVEVLANKSLLAAFPERAACRPLQRFCCSTAIYHL
jgi:hypothetical protein